jgi:hypothetical protein
MQSIDPEWVIRLENVSIVDYRLVQRLENIVIINANILRASIRMNGMMAENINYPKYKEEDFNNIINDEQIGYNDILTLLHRGD